MGSPGAVVVKGEVVVEELGRGKYALFEPVLGIARHQAGQAHNLAFIAAFVPLDLPAIAGQDLLHLLGVGFPILVEKAVKHAPQFDLVFLGGVAVGAEKAIPGGPQLRMGIDEIFKNIGHIQGDPQSHFHHPGHLPQLLEKGLLVAGENLLDGLGTIGNDAEGHGEHGVGFGQQPLEDRLLRGQVAAFRANLVVGNVAHHRGHPPVGDGVHRGPVNAGKAISPLSGSGHDGV